MKTGNRSGVPITRIAVLALVLLVISSIAPGPEAVNASTSGNAQRSSTQEFWVPLVFEQGWPANDFFSVVTILALQNSLITIDGGSPVSILAGKSYSYYNPRVGTHIIVETGCVMAFYNWMVNDYGIWDDCALGYTILPASRLGLSYLIPIEGTVSVVATEPSTRVSYTGSLTPVTLANPGDSLQFLSANGGWIEADKRIGVAVGHYDPVTKGDSYAYTPLPKDLLGVSYHFGKRVPMDGYFPDQTDMSVVGIMAADQGATIAINGVVQPSLPAKGFQMIDQPTDGVRITSDKPIGAAYLQRIQHSDPWNGELRYTSYAYSLVPITLYGEAYLDIELTVFSSDRAGVLTHLVTETEANVRVGSDTPQHYSVGVYDLGILPASTLISSDVPVALEEIGVETWSGVKYQAQGPGFEVFPTEFYTSPFPPKADFSVDRTFIPAGVTVTFRDLSTGLIDSWLWDFGDGSTSTKQNPTHVYRREGNHTVSLTVSNPAGSSTITKEVHIPLQCVADFSVDATSVPVGAMVNFTDLSTGFIDSWLWDFGDGSTTTEQNPIHIYTGEGNYTVSLTVSNVAGDNTMRKEEYIKVYGKPRADFSCSPAEVGAGNEVSFIDRSNGTVASWLWDFGDGSTSTEQNPVHSYRTEGNYTVSLTVFNLAGSDTAKKERCITVYTRSHAAFTFTPAEVTAGGAVSFRDESVGSITSWLWDFGDGSTSTEQNPVHVYRTEGNYTVSLTVSSLAGSDTMREERCVGVYASEFASTILTISVASVLIAAYAVILRTALRRNPEPKASPDRT